MKKINLIKRLWTDSHEKQSPQRFGRYAAMLLLLVMCVTHAYATDLYLRGIYCATDGQNAWYPDNSNKMSGSSSPWSITVYLTGSTEYEFKISDSSWSYDNTYEANNTSATVSLGTAYSTWHNNGKGNMKFTPSANGFYTFTLSSGSLTITRYNPSPSAAAPSNVVSGTNAMFYIEGYKGSNYNVLRANITHSIDANSTGISKGANAISYVNTEKSNLSTNNYVSNNPNSWNGVQNTGISSATGGELFVANSSTSTTSAKTASTSASVTGDVLSISTTTNATTGVLNGSMYIQYYIDGTFTGVTYSASTASYASIPAGGATARASTYNVSGLSNGSHTLKTVLTDGIIYWVADQDNFNVAHTYSITLDDNGSYDGDGSATVKYGDAALTVSSHASRDGWNLVGYWTGSGVSGSQVADAEGNLISKVSGWTDSNGKWIKEDNVKIYAHWSQSYSVTYNANGGTGTTTDASSPYEPGTDVTVLSNSFTRTGYSFTGWNTESNGTGDPYAAGGTIEDIDANVTLYAQWSENLTSVTLAASPAGGGTFTVGGAAATSTTAGVTTTRSVAAVPYPGYRTSATVWTKDNNYISWSSATANPTTITGDGSNGNSTTLTGNFTQTYAYLQGRMTIYTSVARSTKNHIADTEGGWDESSNRIKMDYDATNHRFYRHTYMTPVELSTAQTYGEQYFWFKTSTSSSSDDTNPLVHRPAEGRTLTARGTGNKKATETSSGTNSIWFDDNSTSNGYAIIYFDEAGVWYDVEHSLIYNNNGGSGAVAATACYLHGTNATAAGVGSMSKSYYAFGGWNTNQYITGTNYAAGASVPMNANTTLYAKWTRSITLNANSGGSGSTSVTATYNCATLPSITAPSKEGYSFGGWSTANDGSGNIVINTSGEFLPITGWCDSQKRFTRTADGATLYAKWTQTVTLNANTDNHGSGTNKTATIILNATAKSSITHCTPATGYHLEGYYTAASGGTKILTADGTFASSNITVDAVAYISSGKWVKAGATTLYAHYEPTTYTVTLTPGVGGTGSNGTMTIDYDAAAYKTFSHSITQTGYSISGWYASSTKVLNANGTFAASTVSGYITSDKWTKAANCELAAWWTPNPYAVTFDATTNGGTISGTSPQNVIFAETSISSCPTANKEGYIFDGWYTKASGGKKVINTNGSLVANVTDGSQYTDGSSMWRLPSATTVYAVYVAPDTLIAQRARIDGKRVAIDTLDAKNHPEKDTVIVHQRIKPTPYGNTNISYMLCYENHVALDVQPTIKYGTGVKAGHDTIKMPMDECHVYELVAYLRTGTTRGSGDLVTTDTALISVEKTYMVKVRYMMDGKELRDATEWPVYPSLKTTEIRVPKERNGYELNNLEYGMGVTSDSAKYIYDGEVYATYVKAANTATIIAHYRVPANTVYFFDAFEDRWYTPYIFDYGTTGYWGTGKDAGNGAGAEGHLGTRATSVDFMDRMYMMPIGSTTTKLAIGNDEQKNNDGTGFKYFYDRTYTPEGWAEPITVTPQIFYRTDFNQALSMFVPVATSSSDYYLENTKARYFRGFWVKYSPDRDSTGYYLKVYNKIKKADEPYSGTEPELIQSIPMRLTQTGEDGTWELTATLDLEAGKTYGFKYTKAHTGGTQWYGNSGTMTSANHTDWLFSTGTNNCGLTTTSAGDYTFHLHCVNYGTKAANAASDSEVQGKMVLTVDYATQNGDFRVVYVDDYQKDIDDGETVESIASQTIRARANGEDTVTFYIRKDATNRSMKFQKFNGSTSKWDDIKEGGTIALTNTADQTFTVSKDTTYQIYLKQGAYGTTISATGMDYYTGSYYIRTDCVDEHKWDYKQTLDAHRMVESEYASHLTTDPFTHYYVHWVDGSKNVKFVVATKYSPCLTDTLITDNYANVAGGNLPSAGASVRFMYNKKTNTIKRAYLAGAQGGSLDLNFLKLTETSSSKMKDEGGLDITSITFSDLGNFAYQATIQALPGLTGSLSAAYNSQTQYFRGTALAGETILGGTGGDWQKIVMTYDFKTNRLICAWTPSGGVIDGEKEINADVMIIRKGQGDAQQIVFNTNASKLTEVKYIYGVIQLDYSDLVGMMYSWNYWSYAHCMYYISFPFDVLVSDITGVGTIGQDWRIQRYNGAKRAQIGWFAGDGTTTFWEDVQAGDTLHAYEGYSLLLNRTRFNDSSNPIWENKTYGDKVYLFFPSLNASTGIVANKDVTITVPSHLCTIDRPFVNQYGTTVNHKNTDSHWNMMGTPLFEDKTAFAIGDNPVDPEDDTREELKYIYAWNSAGNTLGIQLTLDNTWKFKSMYSYMVQYAGDVTFKGAAVNGIVAAKRNNENKKYYINLELANEEEFVSRTYVELRENAVDTFMLNEDICMLKNGVNADLYTLAGNYEVGANVLSVGNHTIPVGLDVKKAGTYTFSMPTNFDGEVILVDTYQQTRTNLAVDDYEIALSKGTISDRFYLEINISKTPTAIDGTEGDGSFKDGKAHKFIMNDMMYILNGGVLYDATGKRVK